MQVNVQLFPVFQARGKKILIFTRLVIFEEHAGMQEQKKKKSKKNKNNEKKERERKGKKKREREKKKTKGKKETKKIKINKNKQTKKTCIFFSNLVNWGKQFFVVVFCLFVCFFHVPLPKTKQKWSVNLATDKHCLWQHIPNTRTDKNRTPTCCSPRVFQFGSRIPFCAMSNVSN